MLSCYIFANVFFIYEYMATIKAKLNVCRVTKSGKYPLVIQFIHMGQRRMLRTGLKIEPEYFDMKQECMVYHPGSPYRRDKIREMNRHLQSIRDTINNRIAALGTSLYTADDIAIWFRHCNSRNYLFLYMEQMIEEKKNSRKFGIARAYQSTLNSLRTFCCSEEISFKDVNSQFVRTYELYLQQRNVSQNTIAYYMRNFKTAYHRAASDGIFKLPQQGSPFRNTKVSPGKTIKRALTSEQIRAIVDLDLHAHPDLGFARDMFMASFYLRGIPFVDLAHLMRKNIVNGTIYYRRKKTGALVSVEIILPLQGLMDKYIVDENPYLFPDLMSCNDLNEEEPNEEVLYKAYRRSLFYYNRRLKKIGKLAGLDITLTGYVARHTWATLAKNKGASTAVISEGLGHSSERITQVYLKSFDDQVINRLNLIVSEL